VDMPNPNQIVGPRRETAEFYDSYFAASPRERLSRYRPHHVHNSNLVHGMRKIQVVSNGSGKISIVAKLKAISEKRRLRGYQPQEVHAARLAYQKGIFVERECFPSKVFAHPHVHIPQNAQEEAVHAPREIVLQPPSSPVAEGQPRKMQIDNAVRVIREIVLQLPSSPVAEGQTKKMQTDDIDTLCEGMSSMKIEQAPLSKLDEYLLDQPGTNHVVFDDCALTPDAFETSSTDIGLINELKLPRCTGLTDEVIEKIAKTFPD